MSAGTPSLPHSQSLMHATPTSSGMFSNKPDDNYPFLKNEINYPIPRSQLLFQQSQLTSIYPIVLEAHLFHWLPYLYCYLISSYLFKQVLHYPEEINTIQLKIG